MNVVRIDDPADARIADYRSVRDPVRLERDGVFLVEGRRSVEVLLRRSRFRPRSLLCAPRSVAWLRESGVPIPPGVSVFQAENETLRTLSGVRFHQGCLAAGVRPATRDVASCLYEAADPARVVVLHAVANPENVGTVFRSAAAFRAGAMILSAPCASPLYRMAIRSSLGATLTLPFAHGGGGPDSVKAVRARGYAVAALTPASGAISLEAFVAAGLPQRLALLFGSEGEGLDAATAASADIRVSIPVDPRIDSLNVAAAAAVALYRTGAGPGT